MKHPREVLSSDSENSPKRFHAGSENGFEEVENPATMQEDFAQNQENGNEVQNETLGERPVSEQDWDNWAGWVEDRINRNETAFLEVNAAVGSNREMVENVLAQVGQRVDNALLDYQNAIAEQFLAACQKADEMKEILKGELTVAAREIEDRARANVMELFSAHAVESGALWRGLAQVQTETFQGMISQRLTIEKNSLEESVKGAILEVCKKDILAHVNHQLVAQKEWVEGRFSKLIGGTNARLDENTQKCAVVGTEMRQVSRKFVEFCKETRDHRKAMDVALEGCLEIAISTQNAVAQNGIPAQAQLAQHRVELDEIHQELANRPTPDGTVQPELKRKVDGFAIRMEDLQAQIYLLKKEIRDMQDRGGVVQVDPPTQKKIVSQKSVPESCTDVFILVPLEGEEGTGVTSVQNAILGCVENLFETGGGGTAVHEVQIAPVAASANTDLVGVLNLPIAAHLSKSQAAPKFNGKKEDWQNFIRKFDTWSRAISSGRALLDSEQLQLLNSCLPEYLQKELQLMEREKGKLPSHVEFRAKLEAKFGRAQSENMRKKWQEVCLPRGSGKMTALIFDEFRVNFKLAMADVPDATPEEARRLLFEKLNPFMKRWVAKLEAKKMKNHPVVEFVAKAGATAEDISACVAKWVGTPPKKVEVREGGIPLAF